MGRGDAAAKRAHFDGSRPPTSQGADKAEETETPTRSYHGFAVEVELTSALNLFMDKQPIIELHHEARQFAKKWDLLHFGEFPEGLDTDTMANWPPDIQIEMAQRL